MYIISTSLSYYFTVFTIRKQPFITQFLFLTSSSKENIQFFNRFDRTVSTLEISIFESSFINSIHVQINFERYQKYVIYYYYILMQKSFILKMSYFKNQKIVKKFRLKIDTKLCRKHQFLILVILIATFLLIKNLFKIFLDL